MYIINPSSKTKYISVVTVLVIWAVSAYAKSYGPVPLFKAPDQIVDFRILNDVKPAMVLLDIVDGVKLNQYRRGDDTIILWTYSALSTGKYKFDSYGYAYHWIEDSFTTIYPNASVAEGVGYGTPLLLDLGRNGFHLADAGTSVEFDLLATGNASQYQWVKIDTDDAFLFRDINGNGIVDDGSELFGEGTTMILSSQRADNGYAALSQYDSTELGGNEDGIISFNDVIWDKLSLWIDVNADGISSPDEIISFSEAKITSFDLETKGGNSNRRDAAGNLIPAWSWVQIDNKKGPNLLKMADVYFVSM